MRAWTVCVIKCACMCEYGGITHFWFEEITVCDGVNPVNWCWKCGTACVWHCICVGCCSDACETG